MAVPIFRRAIQLITTGRTVQAEMEDDFHHFHVGLELSATAIESVRAESLRFPWTTCGAEAAQHLSRLEGVALHSLRSRLIREERYTHCTHLFDLVELAVSHIDRAEMSRLYDIAVHLNPEQGAVRTELRMNSDPVFDWSLESGRIVSPGPWAGIAVGEIRQWASDNLDDELGEAVAVLQRALHVSYGKIYDWSAATAADMGLAPTCYTLGTKNAERATPVADHKRHFDDKPQALLLQRVD